METGEHVLRLAHHPHLAKKIECARGESNPMFATSLHPGTWDGPRPGLIIDLVPFGADHLAGPAGREDQKFQATRGNSLLDRNAATNEPIEEKRGAAWCSTRLTLARSGSRWPRQRAGFSLVRCRRAAAQSSVASIRPRTRLAVSVLLRQIGSSTRITSAVSIS